MAKDAFIEVLRAAKSPALPEAEACYDICVAAGIDPAVALAFFQHESTYGKKGLATSTLNWGNIRRSQGRGVNKVIPGRGQFAHYTSWAASLADWCDLIKSKTYIGRGLTTVALVLPVYAPSSDNNKPERYAAAVASAVTLWAAPTRYEVMAATLNIREAPRVNAKKVGTYSKGEIISGATYLGDRVTGYDDPATPEPARNTVAWIRTDKGYVSEAWLREV